MSSMSLRAIVANRVVKRSVTEWLVCNERRDPVGRIHNPALEKNAYHLAIEWERRTASPPHPRTERSIA